MKFPKNKILSKKTQSEQTISEWVRSIGYEISAVCLSLPLFKINLNLFICSFPEYKRFMDEYFKRPIKHEDALAMYSYFTDDDGVEWNFINIQDNSWSAKDYGIIVHELHHFVHTALDRTGIEYVKQPNEEVFAYMQGYFMELMVRALIELNRVSKKKSPPKQKRVKKSAKVKGK